MDEIDIIMQVIEQKGREQEVRIVKDFLIIAIGKTAVAIQIEYLKEVFDVVDQKDVASIPFTPRYIKGIINIRGELVPVLQLSTMLRLECEEDKNKKMVIIEHSKVRVGFPFSEIIDLKTIFVKEIRNMKDILKQTKCSMATRSGCSSRLMAA